MYMVRGSTRHTVAVSAYRWEPETVNTKEPETVNTQAQLQGTLRYVLANVRLHGSYIDDRPYRVTQYSLIHAHHVHHAIYPPYYGGAYAYI
jgi:hypothetical protein